MSITRTRAATAAEANGATPPGSPPLPRVAWPAMAKAKGRYGTTGRVTPKKDEVVDKADRVPPPASGRYTPPVPKEWRESPKWIPVLMFVFLGLGALLIVVNYTPWWDGLVGSSNWYLLGGLGLVTAGFITATRWE